MKTSIKSALLASVVSVGANASDLLDNQDCHLETAHDKIATQVVNCTKQDIETILGDSKKFDNFHKNYELFITQNNLEKVRIIIHPQKEKTESQNFSKEEFFNELKLQSISQETFKSLERLYNKTEQNISLGELVSVGESIIRLEQNNYKTKVEKLADIYLILTAVKPENTIFSLEAEGTKFSLPILENISTVNALLHKKIPQSEVQGYEEMYAKGFEEYKQNSLVEIEEKLNNPKFLAKSIKRRGEKAGIVEGDTEKVIYEKLTRLMLERYEKGYSHTMDKLYLYTQGDPIRGINQFQERAPKTVLQWKNLDGGFEVAYQGLVVENEYNQSIKDLEADRRMTESIKNLAVPFSEEKK